jgi:UDPglucose--hexose-1-phosphate uridylyltransferase
VLHRDGPFWAASPFEILVTAKRHAAVLGDLTGSEQLALAQILGRITRTYDALFGSPFPYSMGFHQRPELGRDAPYWHLHAHYDPPLLRSAMVRKFMVGFELLGGPQRDITPEMAAARLREAAGSERIASGRHS